MKQETNQVNNFEEVFYTGLRPEDKKKSFPELLKVIDDKAWEVGRKINLFGLGTILPVDDSWTNGNSDYKTVNFFGHIGDIFGSSKMDMNATNDISYISENDIEKGYIVDFKNPKIKTKEDSFSNNNLIFSNMDEDVQIEGNLNLKTGKFVNEKFDEAPCTFEPFPIDVDE